MDYLSYWGLKRRPFAQDDNAFFFSAGAQREALAGLGYFIAGTWNSAFLVAPPRSGMTWLLDRLTGMSGFGDCAAEVVLTSGSETPPAIARQLAQEIGIHHQGDISPDDISAAIQTTSRRGIRTVWLIDDCPVAAASLARDLVMADGDFSVVMGTPPDQLASLTAAFGRCSMQIELEPIELADAFQYVVEGFNHAGSSQRVFSDASIVRLHEIAMGRLADLALVAERSLQLAAAQGLDAITSAVVESTLSQEEQSRAA